MITTIFGLSLLSLTPSGWTARAQERARIAPASNGVELDEINIVRRVALDSERGADLTNMQLGLWFAADWKPADKGFRTLIQIQSLDAVEDDTGRILSTQERLKQIEYLRGEVRGNTWNSSGGKQGPVVSLLLDAPARGANKLKAIKGKAHVSLTKAVTLTFNDLAAINGKVLDHPDLKSLAAMKLKFSIEMSDGEVSATLSAPVNYASPRNHGPLQEWAVMDGKKPISLSSERTIGLAAGVTVERTYDRASFKDLSLRLVVLNAVESKTFEFDFREVSLP